MVQSFTKQTSFIRILHKKVKDFRLSGLDYGKEKNYLHKNLRIGLIITTIPAIRYQYQSKEAKTGQNLTANNVMNNTDHFIKPISQTSKFFSFAFAQLIKFMLTPPY